MLRSVSFVLIGFVIACAAPDIEVTDISQQELQAAEVGELLLVDVRSAKEFAGGHVPGALNIPHDELGDRLAELGEARDHPVVVYCQSGRRAGMASTTLIEAGFVDVRHLAGDMSGWRAAELPIE